MDTSEATNQPIRWHSEWESSLAEIIKFPPVRPRDGKLWKTLLQLQKAGLVRVMRDPLGVLRFCAAPVARGK